MLSCATKESVSQNEPFSLSLSLSIWSAETDDPFKSTNFIHTLTRQNKKSWFSGSTRLCARNGVSMLHFFISYTVWNAFSPLSLSLSLSLPPTLSINHESARVLRFSTNARQRGSRKRTTQRIVCFPLRTRKYSKSRLSEERERESERERD